MQFPLYVKLFFPHLFPSLLISSLYLLIKVHWEYPKRLYS